MTDPGAPRGIDSDPLASALRARRVENGLSIRQAAQEAEVSFSTLSRVESGAQPDLASFLRLCAWLRVPPSQFFPTVPARQTSGLEDALVALRSDPRLNEPAVAAITETLTVLYDRLASSSEDPAPTVTCHLRAAATLRPGAAQRLAEILADMQAALVTMDQDGQL